MANSTTYEYIFKSNTSNARTGVESLGNSAEKVTGKMEKLRKKLKSTGDSVTSVGKKMTIGLTGSIALLGGLALKQAASLETMEVAFTSMTGSAEKASEVVKSLVDFTARTPFQLEGVGKAAKQLLSFGVNVEELEDRLKFLGDIAAGANVPLSDMAAIFGKSKAKGKAMTEELLQLSDRGIPIIQVLADKMGVAKSEIFDMASQGKVSFEILSEAMRSMTEQGGIFEDQMARQSETLAGLFSTLKDNVALAMASIGKDLAETVNLKELMAGLTEKIQEATKWFENLSPEVKKTIFVVTGLVATLGPLLITVGAMIKLVGIAIAGIGALKVALLALTGPIGIVIGAVALMTVAIKNNWLGLGDFSKKVWGGITRTVATAQERMKDFTALSWKERLELFKVGASGVLKIMDAFKKDLLGNLVVLAKSAFAIFKLAFAKIATIDFSKVWDNFIDVTKNVFTNIGKSIVGFGKKVWTSFKNLITGGDDPGGLTFDFKGATIKGTEKIKESFEDILGQTELFENTKKAISEVGAELDAVLDKGKRSRLKEELFEEINKSSGETKEQLKDLLVPLGSAETQRQFEGFKSAMQSIIQSQDEIATNKEQTATEEIEKNTDIQDSEKKTQKEYKATGKSVDDLKNTHGKGFDTMVGKTETTVDKMKEKLAELKSVLGQIRSITAPKEGPDKRTDAEVFAQTGAPNPLAPDPFTPFDSATAKGTDGVTLVPSPTRAKTAADNGGLLTDDGRSAAPPINITFENNNFKDEENAQKTSRIMQSMIERSIRTARRMGIPTSS